MSIRAEEITKFLAHSSAAISVMVSNVEGSAPRDTGTFMLVDEVRILGTIGGGQLEFSAIDQARRMLRRNEAEHKVSVPLGPEIGQCCGGRVELVFERIDESVMGDLLRRAEQASAREQHIYIFGAGHVGRALAHAMSLMPFKTIIADTRPAELANLPANVKTQSTILPETLVRAAPSGCAFIVLTHDHALDFLIMGEILRRGDAAYAGLIGSRTKRARFRRWFLDEGGNEAQLTGLTCPIGGAGLGDKRPEIIAALTCAEIVANIATNEASDGSIRLKAADKMGVMDGG